MPTVRVDDPAAQRAIDDVIRLVGGDPDSFDGRMVSELIETCLKLVPDRHDTGQIKLMNRALKEMRYAYRVFNGYRGTRKISIFGSARTPPSHPDYVAAREFSAAMAKAGWMAITGAGDGIMKAGHEGPRREASFGLSIRLPFETTANTFIAGDPKLVNFRYFFTRKLMFMSHSDAVAAFPGGFGTQDELFETLTLVQTGKSNLIPIVLIEGQGGVYWKNWDMYVRSHLSANGWISPEDPGIYHIARSIDDAVDHVTRFYRVYHSSRYVRDLLVLRLHQPLTAACLASLSAEFAPIIASGGIESIAPLPEESDHLELPRIAFHHNRRRFGLVRSLIDRINAEA
jgi:uncharacterized protein (TIGR00730 family)